MSATIHVLNPKIRPLSLYLRLGHSGHRVLEDIHAAGKAKIDRAIVDAAHFATQKDLIQSLRDSGVELSLDTKAAELTTIGGFSNSVSALPWAGESPQTPEDFDQASLREYALRVAEFAVAGGMNRVLCPTRPLDGPRSPWLRLDPIACELLRSALDREGGSAIAIDYPLLLSYEALRDEASRTSIMAVLRDLPFDNLSLRISGFGNTATAAGVRRYINAAWDFTRLGKPLVADGVGGLVGEALLSFGGVGALAHGVAEKERFNSKDWMRPRSGQGGGGGKRIYLPEIDVYVKGRDVQDFFAVHRAKALLACNDMNCCPRGVEDMTTGWQRHFLNQRGKQIAALNEYSQDNLARIFLERRLNPAGRAARQAERLKFDDPLISSQLHRKSRTIDKMVEVLEDLCETTEIPVAKRPSRALPGRGATGTGDRDAP